MEKKIKNVKVKYVCSLLSFKSVSSSLGSVWMHLSLMMVIEL